MSALHQRLEHHFPDKKKVVRRLCSACTDCGVNFSQADWPAWYTIGYHVLWQVSYILLAPVWMLGMSLLYVDERVRHEGYDVELMAARQLSEMPQLNVSSPLAPALADKSRRPPPPPPPPMASGSVLGLS